MNLHIPKWHRTKDETNQRDCKLFSIEVERTNLFQNFPDRTGTNQIIPKLFKIEVEQKKLFQIFSRGFDGCTGPG